MSSFKNIQDFEITRNNIFTCHYIIESYPFSVSRINKNTNLLKSIKVINTQGNLYTLSINPGNPKVLLTGGYYQDRYGYKGCLYKSDDEGLKWHRIFEAENRTFINSAYSNYLDDNFIVIGSDNGIFLTKDDGKNWEKIHQTRCSSVCISQYGLIFAVCYDQLIVSKDEGKNWEELDQQNNIRYYNNCLKIDEMRHNLFAGSSKGLISYKIKY